MSIPEPLPSYRAAIAGIFRGAPMPRNPQAHLACTALRSA